MVEEEEEEVGGSMEAPPPLPPPLSVYADFEAMQNAEGVFVTNLLCYSSAEEETIHVLEGENCTLQFLHGFDALVVVPGQQDQEREILVVFHNLKGFDGMFILHELYQQQREVTEQLAPKSCPSAADPSNLSTLCVSCPCLWPRNVFRST